VPSSQPSAAELHPLSYERFVDYWSGDLAPAQQDALEEHLIDCAVCGRLAETWGVELSALREAMSEMPPGYLTAEQVASLGHRAEVVVVPPSGGLTVKLRPHTVHVFRVSLDLAALADVERLDVEYLKDGYPEPIFHVSSLPRTESEVHLACHSHVLSAHGDTTVRVLGTRQGQQVTVFESDVHFI
jgi:hypothetical protein